MTKDFIPYQQALVLKELGFDEPCWAWWHIEDCDIRYCYSDQRSPIINSRETEIVGLPTYAQVFRWFRDQDYYSDITTGFCRETNTLGFSWRIWRPWIFLEEWSPEKPTDAWSYETYEQAQQFCLEKLIQILKSM